MASNYFARMLSFLILPTNLYFSQCYLSPPVAAITALNSSSGSNITISNDHFKYSIPETPYAINIWTLSTTLIPLNDLQRLYDRTLSTIDEYIHRGGGGLIPDKFVSGRESVQLTWEEDSGAGDRPVNFTMFKKIILGLESVHAEPSTPLVGVYRRFLRFFVEERYAGELLIAGGGQVLPVDGTGPEAEGDSLFINGSHVNSSVIDS